MHLNITAFFQNTKAKAITFHRIFATAKGLFRGITSWAHIFPHVLQRGFFLQHPFIWLHNARSANLKTISYRELDTWWQVLPTPRASCVHGSEAMWNTTLPTKSQPYALQSTVACVLCSHLAWRALQRGKGDLQRLMTCLGLWPHLFLT